MQQSSSERENKTPIKIVWVSQMQNGFDSYKCSDEQKQLRNESWAGTPTFAGDELAFHTGCTDDRGLPELPDEVRSPGGGDRLTPDGVLVKLEGPTLQNTFLALQNSDTERALF